MSGASIRLDRCVQTQPFAAGLGRRRLASIFECGAVRVNGARARKGTIVRAGDVVTIAPLAPAAALPSSMPLSLVYHDDAFVAVDKPPGVPSTLGPTVGSSVAAELLARFPEMAAIDRTRHAGLVHRLDTGTSGLLLAARRPDAWARLRDAFRRKAVAKDYLAVVTGRVAAPRVVSIPLARRRRGHGRMVPARPNEPRTTWPAETEIVPLTGDAEYTVVRLRMRTGVTHQLRVHLATIGHAIVGDVRYGSPAADGAVPGWHYLHAWMVTFDDPALPRGLVTPFPAHWRPLFATRDWSTTVA